MYYGRHSKIDYSSMYKKHLANNIGLDIKYLIMWTFTLT